ncbi:HAD family hydrolase [Lacisediminihabitans sp.]|uniref:HAD family hydrolase n=1 Tax=Lacisediminihabitans sp. TaxID=2787631 RepID=UPI00374DF9DC
MTLPPVVLFDLDDTLFAHRRAVGLGVTAHRRAIGTPLAEADDDAELARWHDLEEHHYARYLAGELDFLEQRRHRARDFVEPYGLDLASDHEADQWFDDYLVQYQLAWTLHDDALPCLDELDSRGVRIGIITNGDLRFQLAKLDRMGLTLRLEHVIASGELGYAKPDPRIFEHACALFGVQPSDAAYVGDRLETDAIGAASAGLAGVWIDRLGVATAEELGAAAASGVRVISSLDELHR